MYCLPLAYHPYSLLRAKGMFVKHQSRGIEQKVATSARQIHLVLPVSQLKLPTHYVST